MRSFSPRLCRALLAVVCATLAVVPAAGAELVGEFDAAVRNFKRSYGAYTVVADARVYDTTGAPPPALTKADVYFPRGAAIRRAFLTPRHFCDAALLERRPDRRLCPRAHFASGTVLLDARPHVVDALPADVELYLGPPRGGRAVASVLVLAVPSARSPVYAYQVLKGAIYPAPRALRRFGYRLELPTRIEPLIPGITLHLAELHLRIYGLTRERRSRVCMRRAGSACVRSRRTVRRTFWTRLPDCPPTRKVLFGAVYAFEGSSRISKRRSVSCRRFARRPAAHGKGRIPGAPGAKAGGASVPDS